MSHWLASSKMTASNSAGSSGIRAAAERALTAQIGRCRNTPRASASVIRDGFARFSNEGA